MGEVPGAPGRLRFSHALVRDTLYDELTPGAAAAPARAGRRGDRGALGRQRGAASGGARLSLRAGGSRRGTPSGRSTTHDVPETARRRCSPTRRRPACTGWPSTRSSSRGGATRRFAASCCSPSATPRPGAAPSVPPRRPSCAAAGLARELGAADQLARAALGYGGRYVWFRAGKDQRLITPARGCPGRPARPEQRTAGDAPRPTGRRAARPTRSRAPGGAHRGGGGDRPQVGDPETLAYAIEGTYASISWPRDADRWLSMATELSRSRGSWATWRRPSQVTSTPSAPSWCRGTSRLPSSSSRPRRPSPRSCASLFSCGGSRWRGVMRALQVGRFEEAEELVEREAALGSGQGGLADDATFQYVSHFHDWALRRERGELAETRGSLEQVRGRVPRPVPLPLHAGEHVQRDRGRGQRPGRAREARGG